MKSKNFNELAALWESKILFTDTEKLFMFANMLYLIDSVSAKKFVNMIFSLIKHERSKFCCFSTV